MNNTMNTHKKLHQWILGLYCGSYFAPWNTSPHLFQSTIASWIVPLWSAPPCLFSNVFTMISIKLLESVHNPINTSKLVLLSNNQPCTHNTYPQLIVNGCNFITRQGYELSKLYGLNNGILYLDVHKFIK